MVGINIFLIFWMFCFASLVVRIIRIREIGILIERELPLGEVQIFFGVGDLFLKPGHLSILLGGIFRVLFCRRICCFGGCNCLRTWGLGLHLRSTADL